MNIEVEMKPNFGPFIPNPIDSKEKVKNLITPNVMDKLGYVFEAIKVTKRILMIESFNWICWLSMDTFLLSSSR